MRSEANMFPLLYFGCQITLRGGEEASRWCHGDTLSTSLIINLNAVEAAVNKELKRNSLAESEKKKRRSSGGKAWIIHLAHNQRCLPYLWVKSPHRSARIVLCLQRNAIKVHLKLNGFEVSHTDGVDAPLLSRGSSFFFAALLPPCAVVTRVQITVAVSRSITSHLPLSSVYVWWHPDSTGCIRHVGSDGR